MVVLWALLCGAITVIASACSASSDNSPLDTGTNNTGGGAAAGGTGTGGGAGWTIGPGGSGGGVGMITVLPQNPVLIYTTPPVTQQFTAQIGGQTVSPSWSLDDAALGTIDPGGLFTASGAYGGVTKVTAQFGAEQGSTSVTVKLVLTENPSGVPQTSIDLLHQGGSADAQFRWLYPYDGTVFPRGLTSPTLQFGGTLADAVWVHAESQSQSIVYDGYFTEGGLPAPRVKLPDATWKAISYSVGAGETLTIKVTKLTSGQVTGPATETWKFGQAPLKGTLYYNSYDSALANGIGAVLKLKPGSDAQLVVGGGGKCTVCHSVAMNGSVMLASNTGYGTGAKYDLTNNAAQSGERNDYVFEFPAVYPDGSVAVSTSGRSIGGMWNNASGASQLYDVASGAQLTAPGLSAVKWAAMPAFAPSGKKMVFNNEDTGNGHTLTVMDFDRQSNTFSGLTPIANDPNNALGWPSFLPDDSAVLFDRNTGAYGQSANGRPDYGNWMGNRADLAMVDLATKTLTPLDELNGLSGNNIYLPFGADDAQRNFEPCVMPLAVGGYYWVVFTSRRQYGNTINVAETGQYGDTAREKLWIAAIDVNAVPGQDPSHPAVFLDGQEIGSGNMRGFWVLDPCKPDNSTCDSGDECCGGFCRQINDQGTIKQECVPPPAGCSNEFEACVGTADCCGAADGYTCINGHCAAPPPPR